MASKKFGFNDEVVVIIGSGAGGGTLGNELAQKGINVVILEAGKRHEINDFENDEWPMFSKISWLDKRTTSGRLGAAHGDIAGRTQHFAAKADECGDFVG